MKFLLLAALFPGKAEPLLASTNKVAEQRTLTLIMGAPGEDEYEIYFAEAAELWRQAATNGGLRIQIIGQDTNAVPTPKEALLQAITEEKTRTTAEWWLVFLGHGTFDGRSAKFNLRGPDISAEELAQALDGTTRPLAVVQTASASGPFLKALSSTNRVIITATRSGNEMNATRFGMYIARAVTDRAGDLDKDGQTSLLEAFLVATRAVDLFYREEGRLATEHALLDDNGDGLGTSSEFFKGVRAVKAPADGKQVDGIRAHQMHLVRSSAEEELPDELRARRDTLEQELSVLRARKEKLAALEYEAELERILVEIARLYEQKPAP